MFGIIGAMDEEVSAVLNLMTEVKRKSISQISFFEGKLAEKDVVLMQSGVGKVKAAMTTTMLLDCYDIEGVINIGTAGGLHKDSKVLDVIIASQAAQFDVDLTPFGYEKSFAEERTAVYSDNDYIQHAAEIMMKLHDGNRVFIAPMVTSDQFIHTPEQVELILKDYPEALCADMEAAAIGMVCRQFSIPFTIIRSLSDVAVQKNNTLTFEEYVEKASARSAEFCRQFIKQI